MFGANFNMNKAEIEEVLATKFNCTWTDGGCTTVAGENIVNSTINIFNYFLSKIICITFGFTFR